MLSRRTLVKVLRRTYKVCHNSERYLSTLWRRQKITNDILYKFSFSTTAIINNVEEGVIKSPYGTMDFPNQKIHECIYENIEEFGDKTALECGLTGRKYTYETLRRVSGTLAASLMNKLHMHKGDVGAVFLPNMPEYAVIFLAASECGVRLTTINSTYRSEEIATQIQLSNVKLIFTIAPFLPVVEAAFKTLKISLPIIVIKNDNDSVPNGVINFFELIDPSTCGVLKPVDTTNDDVAVLPFSSGTSGLPKGVQLTHKNIVSNVLQLVNGQKGIGIDDSTEIISLGILPMFHIYGMTCITFSILKGKGTLITLPKFDPGNFLDLIIKKNINTLYLVPPLILFLIKSPHVTPEHMKRISLIINGASPIGHKDFEKLREKVPNDCFLGQGYGMTETSPAILISNKERAYKYGSTGVPLISTEVKVVDPDTLKAQPANSVGELWVKGPQVMKGYLNNPKATDEIFKDGWLRTGDLAYYDDEKYFFIVDRLKELIKVKGFQVAPAELEEILRTHPKVMDAAVIGITHDRKGQVPKAFVVLQKDAKASEDEIKEFIKNKVAPHKTLDGGVVFLDEIPKSTSGKILKKSLK